MMLINRQVISYKDLTTHRERTHHILIAKHNSKKILLSHVNLYIYANASSSLNTSNRYSNALTMFYVYLSSLEKFKVIDVSQYHVITTNEDIKNWQIERQVFRVEHQSTFPTSETIFEDAKIVLQYFKWLADNGFSSGVKIVLKTWVANFKNKQLLNYVHQKATQVIDAKNITILDKEHRQKRLKSLITRSEIMSLVGAFVDPVYASLFRLSLDTAMRPIDLCKFPYIGKGPNKHIMPFGSMAASDTKIYKYTVERSKGNKTRVILINMKALQQLDDEYIKRLYYDRAQKYEKKYGHKCPPSILFLNSKGVPVTERMITARAHIAKKIAMSKDPDFRESVTFYDARHWWPTMVLIRFFGEKLLTESADVLYAAVAEVLINQMGHEDIETTYKYYIDMGRLIMLAHKGVVNDLITDDSGTVGDFLQLLE